MAITPEPEGSVAAPNEPNAQAVEAVALPLTIPSKTAGTVDVPNVLTAEPVGVVQPPN